MMTDKTTGLVTKLRALADCDARSGAPLGQAMKHAADEIERLRAGLAEIASRHPNPGTTGQIARDILRGGK